MKLMKLMALGFGLFFLTTSCTREVQQTNLKIQLPGLSSKATNSSSQKISAFSTTSPWLGTAPTALGDINCYAVLVGGPEEFMQRNVALRSDSTGDIRFGDFRMFVPAGGTIELEVSSGTVRHIYLLGFKAAALSNCVPPPPGADPDFANLSEPYVISSKTENLPSGDYAMTMTASWTGAYALSQFNGPDFHPPDSTGNPTSSLWGDGRDGTLITTAGETVSFSTDTFSTLGNITHSPATNGPDTSKKLSATRRVTNIDTTTATTLSLDAAITADDFDVDDEIMWHVVSGWAPSMPDINACGGNLARGAWGFAKIISTTSGSITLNNPISINPGSINNTNIITASFSSGTSHCRIQVLRVPNFELFHVQHASVITVNGHSGGKGGVIAFRAKELRLNDNLFIQSNGNGFLSPSAAQGEGISGMGSPLSSNNENGGGQFSGQSCGGGNGGRGADSYDAYCSGNTSIVLCGGSACKPIADMKVFFGGAGGGDGGYAGGNGGGIIIIHAEKITGGTSLLRLETNGGSPGTGSPGAGAGGSIHLTNNSIDTGITVQAFATGGNAMGNGGSGGGGVVEIAHCASNNNGSIASISSTQVAKGAYAGYGTDADDGLFAVSNEPGLCGP